MSCFHQDSCKKLHDDIGNPYPHQSPCHYCTENIVDSVKVDGKSEHMTFGAAINLCKEGRRIARKGWNGKRQYVELASCISYKNARGEIVNAGHDAIGNQALAFVGTSGVQIGWLASQADMLAEDWFVVEHEKLTNRCIREE